MKILRDGNCKCCFFVWQWLRWNLGLKTSYQEFYDFYLNQDTKDKIILDLKECIKTNRETWSDLERQLGEFTQEINTQQELDLAILDLVRNLRLYLSEIEQNIVYSKFNRDMLLNDLANPERVMSARDQRDVNSFKQKFKGNDKHLIHILSFNYTKVVENILDGNHSNLEISKSSNRVARLQGVEHIHGYVNQRLVLGLNDKNQIANPDFRDSQDTMELLVKPAHNEQLGHLRDDFCFDRISKATMIYIFGSSIGETDKIWWEAVGKRVGQHCCLVIYYRGKNTDENTEILEARRGRDLVTHFLSLTNLDDRQKEKAREYIYTATTKDLFKLTKST